MARNVVLVRASECPVADAGIRTRRHVRQAALEEGLAEDAAAAGIGDDMQNKNFSRRQPDIPNAPMAHVFEHCNFAQEHPGTVLENFAGKAITFRHCNLVNVAVDDAWTVEDCNTAQGELPPEPTEAELKAQQLEALRHEVARLEAELN